MKRCYEVENYEAVTGHKEEVNHCGDSTEINGVYYCSCDGKLKGYFGYCADIEPIRPICEQLSFFDSGDKNQI